MHLLSRGQIWTLPVSNQHPLQNFYHLPPFQCFPLVLLSLLRVGPEKSSIKMKRSSSTVISLRLSDDSISTSYFPQFSPLTSFPSLSPFAVCLGGNHSSLRNQDKEQVCHSEVISSEIALRNATFLSDPASLPHAHTPCSLCCCCCCCCCLLQEL